MTTEVRIHRLAKIHKLDPLFVSYAPNGKLRMVRWPANGLANGPNAVAMEDLPAGGAAVLDLNGGIYEVRAKK